MPIFDEDPKSCTYHRDGEATFLVGCDCAAQETCARVSHSLLFWGPEDGWDLAVSVAGRGEWLPLWERVKAAWRVLRGCRGEFGAWMTLDPPTVRGWAERLAKMAGQMESGVAINKPDPTMPFHGDTWGDRLDRGDYPEFVFDRISGEIVSWHDVVNKLKKDLGCPEGEMFDDVPTE